MNYVRIAIKQLITQGKYYLYFAFTALLLLAFAFYYAKYKNVDPGFMTRDTATVLKGPAYTGFISNIGIICWIIGGSICVFTATLLFKAGERSKILYFFLLSGMLSFLLGADDMFQLHEKLLTHFVYFAENLFYLFYAFVILYITLYCWQYFSKTEFVFLVMAIGLFFLSLVVDRFNSANNLKSAFWEDTPKFLGIILWTVYFLRTANLELKKRLR